MGYIESAIYKSLDPAHREIVAYKAGIHKNGKQIDPNCQKCGACCVSFSIKMCEYLQISIELYSARQAIALHQNSLPNS